MALEKQARGTARRAHAKRTRAAKTLERQAKAETRARDRRCRWPLCRCHERREAIHVAHLEHKGMGGDSRSLRSRVEKMIVLCRSRHRESVWSVDQGTLMVDPRTSEGTNGRCDFYVRLDWSRAQTEHILGGALLMLSALAPAASFREGTGNWTRVAREVEPGRLEPLSDWQRWLLEQLNEV